MKLVLIMTALAAGFVASSAAQATTHNGVTNADLTQIQGGGTVTESSALEFDKTGGKGIVLQGWTNLGYNFVYTPGTADDPNASQVLGQYGRTYMWGPNSGSENGFTGVGPTGGNILGLDGAFEVGAASTTITGMTVGDSYTLSFDYAGIQQHGFTGPTTETVKVTIGGTTYPKEPVLDDATHGFTGWNHETISFTATAASEALSFLAIGTPNGLPPFTLVSGISVPVPDAVPEPATWTIMLLGVGMVGGLARRRRAMALALTA